MFACISGHGVGLRLPAATATELQFSRDNVVPFQPGGVASTREWIQIDRADAADYEKDLPLFQAPVGLFKGAGTRYHESGNSQHFTRSVASGPRSRSFRLRPNSSHRRGAA